MPGAPLTSRAFVENLKAYAKEAGAFAYVLKEDLFELRRILRLG